MSQKVYPHSYLLCFAYPDVDEWCVREAGKLRSLCGAKMSTDVNGVTPELLNFSNVCSVCRAIYLATAEGKRQKFT